MKKIITLAIILTLLNFMIGCFDVERNNPFDPDSDLPDSEKMVTVKGFTYRGYSDHILPNVEVTIGGKTTVSDSGGFYSIDLMRGTHNLRASKGGWTTEEYQINVNAKATATQYEDISMFIWYEYWEAFNPGEIPEKHWCHNPGIQGYNVINNNDVLQIGIYNESNNMDSTTTWLPYWDNKTTPINNVLIGLRFDSTYYSETSMLFCFEDATSMHIISVEFYSDILYVNSSAGASVIVEDQPNNITNRNIMVEFRVNPSNRTKGTVYFYNHNGDSIFTSADVTFTVDFNPETLRFLIFDAWGAGSGVWGMMQVLFVEFF
ncbi:carboxypeptidase regulatory-like domain-containing protein [Candidatus Dependentiae bacterium]|nr:carboxypeptidase regulatory-like domain-containing protein [Candidatus Dependentiae bacterium]